MVWNILTWGSKVETETVKVEVADDWVVLDKTLDISEVFDEFIEMKVGSESDLEIKVHEIVTKILSGKTLQKVSPNDFSDDVYERIRVFVAYDKKYTTFSFEKLAKYGKTIQMVEFIAEQYIKCMTGY